MYDVPIQHKNDDVASVVCTCPSITIDILHTEEDKQNSKDNETLNQEQTYFSSSATFTGRFKPSINPKQLVKSGNLDSIIEL